MSRDEVWNSYDKDNQKKSPPCAVYGCKGRFHQFIVVDEKEDDMNCRYFRIPLCYPHAKAYNKTLRNGRVM